MTSTSASRVPLDYNALAADYARYRQIHPGVLRALIAGGGLQPDSRALEVGCGTGNYILALRQATGCAAWGIDPSPQMLARAAARGGARFAIGRAEALGFPAGAFDLVFSVDVIHHVTGRLALFEQARRALAAGGRVCTATDSEWIIRNRVPLSRYFPATVEPELRRYPPIPLLHDLMRQAGFVKVREDLVELAYPLNDIAVYRAKAYSALRLIPEEAFQAGLEAMEADLRRGPITGVSRYLLMWGE